MTHPLSTKFREVAPASFELADADRLELALAEATERGAAAWPGVQYVFGGHVHLQTLYYQGAGGNLMPFAPQPGISIPAVSYTHLPPPTSETV